MILSFFCGGENDYYYEIRCHCYSIYSLSIFALEVHLAILHSILCIIYFHLVLEM